MHSARQKDDACPRQQGLRFHHAAQKGAQFKTYTLFISGIFHLVILDHNSPQVTEMSEGKTIYKRELVCEPTF